MHRLTSPEHYEKARLVTWNCDDPDHVRTIRHFHRDELQRYADSGPLANLALPALNPDTMTITEFQIEQADGEWKSSPLDLRPPCESRATAVRRRKDLFKPTTIFVIDPAPSKLDPYRNFLAALATEVKVFDGLDAALVGLSSDVTHANDALIVCDSDMGGYAKAAAPALRRLFSGKMYAIAKTRKLERLKALGYDAAYEQVTSRMLRQIHLARERMRFVSV